MKNDPAVIDEAAGPAKAPDADMRKAALISGLECAVNVIATSQDLLAAPELMWTRGERQTVAVTLEQIGRLAYTVAGKEKVKR